MIKNSVFILLFFVYNCSDYSIDICKCLNNAPYYNKNESKCDKAINKELGHNWKTTNYSQDPEISAKFDALTNRCN